MPSAPFIALAERAHHTPVLVVKATLQNGVGSGETSFYFCDASAPQVPLRLKAGSGIDVLPLLLKAGGVSTSIDPGKVSTSRGVRSVRFKDVPNWPEDFGAGGLASTGGSLFQRMFIAFPGWHRSKVETFLGFDDSTLSSLANWEPLFTGQLEDTIFQGDDEVEWQLTDIYALKGEQVPTPVGDDQTLIGAVSSTDNDFKPSAIDLWLEPQGELPSQDWLAPILVLRPDTANEERVAIARWTYNVGTEVAGYMRCCQNRLTETERFQSNWPTTGGTWTTTPDAVAGPWGPENGTQFETATADEKYQDTTLADGPNAAGNFSVWMREHPDYPGATVQLVLRDSYADRNVLNCVLTPYWKRFDAGISISGAATFDTFICGLRVAGAVKFYATQAQFIYDIVGGFAKQFYVPGTGPAAGLYAGRGVFGSTRQSHPDAAAITERAYYRKHGAAADSVAEGLHPVWIVADLLNRGYVPPRWQDATLHLERFQQEADYRAGARLRRVLVDPQDVEALIVEVCEQFILSVWCDRRGYMKCRIDWRPGGPNYPPAPGNVWATLYRDHDMVQRGDKATSFRVEGNSQSRANYVRVAWGLRVDSDGKEKGGDRIEDYQYLVVEGDFDPSVVGSDFRSLAGKTIYAKWIYQRVDAIALAGRLLSRFKRGARKLMATIGFRKFTTLDVGDSYRIIHPSLRSLLGTDAAASSPLFQIMEIAYGDHAEDMPVKFLEARQTRIAHITPTSTDYSGTFPNDYDLATADQRDFYGFIGNTSNKVGSASDDGYVIG